jgi:hypothetical protein
MNRVILSYTLMLFLLSCSKRDRLNPLDVANKITGGKPTGLNLVPIRDTVQVSWDNIDVHDLSDYVIHKAVNNTGLMEYATVSAASTEFSDSEVSYYQNYTYAVQAVTDYMVSPLSDTVSVTVGPYSIYVADFYDNSVRILSWDGSYLIKSQSVSSPRAIQYRESDNRFAVADYYDNAVLLLSTDLNETEYIDIGDYPLDLDVNQLTNRIHVLTRNGYIMKLDEEGEKIETLNVGMPFGWDAEISSDPISDGLWISNPDSGIVWFLPYNEGWNHVVKFNQLDSPSSLSSFGGGWVATHAGIVHLSPSGDSEILEPDIYVTDVEIDTVSKQCFYVGKDLVKVSWVAGKIDLETKFNTILLDGDYHYLHQIYPIPGEIGTEFMIQESKTWTLIRFDVNGNKLGEIHDFNSRLDFQIY